MARGISSEDVGQAADQLLAAGERPTAERVRVALGRGSPNTIGPMLETWWSGLAQRLRTQLALPGVPAELGGAFAAVWAQALAAGQAHAESAVAPERAALAEALAKVEAAGADERALRTGLEQQLARAEGDAKAAHAVLAISEQRNGDLLREAAAQKQELHALGARLDATLARHHLVTQQAEDARAAAAAERDRLQALLRQVEDRAYTEVDRARQELKAMKAQLAAQAKEHTSALRRADQARRSAEAALAKARATPAPARARRTTPAATKPRATTGRRT